MCECVYASRNAKVTMGRSKGNLDLLLALQHVGSYNST